MEFTNSWKVTAIVGVMALAVGYGTARYTTPAKVITKTQEIVKTVTTDNKDTVTTETTIKKPDGTVITQNKTEDLDKIVTNENENITSDKTVINVKPDWMVSGAYGMNYYNAGATPIYGFGLKRRILGPIFVGADTTVNKNSGLSVLGTISIEF